jgi:16S rRNA C967 or C1407 C5-methylase (RsmB/RsmF family)
LLSAWGALKPGGVLVYSTCTFSAEENELQIARLLERFKDAEVASIEIDNLKRGPIITEWKGRKLPAGLQKALRVMPTNEIEGFFIAKLIKKLN